MNADSSSVKINVFGAKPLPAQGPSFSERKLTTACQPGFAPRWVQGKDGSWAQDGCKVNLNISIMGGSMM